MKFLRPARPVRRSASDKARGRRTVGIHPLHVEVLEDRTVPASNLDPLASQLPAALEQVDSGFRAILNDAPTTVPVLNDPLKEVGQLVTTVDRFQNLLQSAINSALAQISNGTPNDQARSAIQSSLWTALGPAGVNVLGDRNGGGLAIDDVLVENVNVAAGTVTIEVRLTGTNPETGRTFVLGTGLPGVPVGIEGGGELNVETWFDYPRLRFGLGPGAAFFLDTNGTDDLRAGVRATLAEPTVSGLVGFLVVDGTAAGPNQVTADLTFDVQGAGTSFQVVNPRLTGGADINLTLTGSFTDNAAIKYQIPSVAVDFRLHWPFNAGSPQNGLATFGAEPTVDFNNVRVSMGNFLGSTVRSIVEDVNTALKPIQPVLDVLNFRLPGLSDLTEAGGLGPVSLLTLANVASSIGVLPPNVKLVVELVNTVSELSALVDHVLELVTDDYLPVGGFNLNDRNADLRGLPTLVGAGQSLRDAIGLLTDTQALTSLESIAGGTATLETLVENSDLPGPVKERLHELSTRIKIMFNQAEDGLKLEFPILENPRDGVFNLLLGRDTDFVTFTANYNFKELNVDQRYPMFSAFVAQLEGFIRGAVHGLDVHLKVGYDSYGLRKALKPGADLVSSLLDGFYIDASRPLIQFDAEIGVGLAASVPIIGFTEPITGEYIGIRAGVEVSSGLELNDFRVSLTNPGDGKFRVNRGADQLLETSGRLSAGIKFEIVAHTPIPLLDDIVVYSKKIAEKTLINLGDAVFKANPFKTDPAQPVPQTPMVIDLNSVPEGRDRVPNQIRVERRGGQAEVWLYNGSTATEPLFPARWIRLGARPFSSVKDIVVRGGGDDDRLTVPPGLGKLVTFDGRGGDNSLVVGGDYLAAGNTRYVFTHGRIDGGAQVAYSGVDRIFTNARPGGNHTAIVNELAAGVHLTIDGNNTFNKFVIGETSVGRIRGDLQLRGGNGTDQVVFNDTENKSIGTMTWEIWDNRVERIATGIELGGFDENGNVIAPRPYVDTHQLDLAKIESLTIHGGRGALLTEEADGVRFKVHATTTDVALYGGPDDDVFTFGDNEFGLDGLTRGRRLFVSGNGGNDTTVIDDRASAPPEPPARFEYATTNHSVSRKKPGTPAVNLGFSHLTEDVRLYGNRTADARYDIKAFAGIVNPSRLGLFTGTGADSVVLGTYATGLSRIDDPLDLRDAGGADNVTVNASNLVLDPGQLTPAGGPPITHTAFEKVSVRAPAGNTTVEVRGLDEGVEASILGASRVTVGAGNLSDVRGLVNIRTDNGAVVAADGYQGNPTTSLTINDSLNPTPTSYNLGAAAFAATRPGGPNQNVTFGSARLRFVTLYGGSGGNAVTVTDTQPATNTMLTWLYTGAGADTVTVERAKSSISIMGQGGADVVKVGTGGSVQGITANLAIRNSTGKSTIDIDNSADTTPHTVRLDRNGDDGTITGLTPRGTIRVDGWGTSSMTVRGGGGGNTFDVVNTFPTAAGSGATTTLYTGAGDDRINVIGTTSPLTVDPQGGSNRVTIGGRPASSGDLTGLAGDLTLRGEAGVGSHTVDVIDRGFPANFTYRMDDGRLERVAAIVLGTQTTTIHYDDFPFAGLNLFSGHGNNRFEVSGTPAATAGVRLKSGRGVDTLTLLGTNGDLTVDLGNGESQQVEIGDATHALEALAGVITIESAVPVVARITNEASTEGQGATFDRIGPTGISLYRSEFRNNQYYFESELRFNRISNLDFRYGRGYENVGVNGTPTGMTLNAYSAPGQLDFLSVHNSYDRVLGPVHFYAQESDKDGVYAYDYLNPNPHTYTFRADPNAAADVIYERDGQAPFYIHGAKNILFYAAKGGGNTVNIQYVPAGAAHTAVLGPGDLATVGSAAPQLGGTLAGIRGAIGFAGGPDLRLTFDDSGNTDPTPKRVTLQPGQGPNYLGQNLILGLTGSGISWPAGRVALIDILGGSADETFAVSGNPSPAAVRIDGGGGTNTLDYAGYDSAYQGLASVYAGEDDATDGHGSADGTLSGGVTFVPGQVGQAFEFDGLDDFVHVPTSAALESPTVTVEAWVNSAVTGRNRYLVAKGANSTSVASYALYTGEQHGLRFYVSDGTTYVESPDAGAGLWDGAWHHVVGAFDGRHVRLYVDGVEVGTGTFTTVQIAYDLPTSNDLFLGTYNAGTNNFWPYAGKLDEVSLFGRALNPVEVQARFAAGGRGLYGTGVTVSLAAGSATGFASVSRIRDAIGSTGDDVLVGNGGNVLTGGAGRDVLIAGPTASTLLGGAGEDFLIGGATVHDSNPAALAAIRAEWSRTDVDEATRLNNLRAGLLASGQVTSNNQPNSLFGEADADVFFGASVRDLSDRNGEAWVDL